MDIKKAKDLIDEYRGHEKIVRTIESANSNHNWVAICTPRNKEPDYISDVQIKLVLDASKSRMQEIEKLFDGINISSQ